VRYRNHIEAGADGKNQKAAENDGKPPADPLTEQTKRHEGEELDEACDQKPVRQQLGGDVKLMNQQPRHDADDRLRGEPEPKHHNEDLHEISQVLTRYHLFQAGLGFFRFSSTAGIRIFSDSRRGTGTLEWPRKRRGCASPRRGIALAWSDPA
jgi:hypothetical protein